MAIFFQKAQIVFEEHPKYQGVRIAKMVTSQQSAQAGVSMLEIASGIEIPIHTHDTQIDSIHVLEGSGKAYINEDWKPIGAGDYIFVPAKEEHGVKNDGQAMLKLFIVHSPPLF